MNETKIRLLTGLAIAFLVLSPASGADQADQAQPSPQERVANLKAWLAASQAQLRAYEWIETTVITHDGEEKARKQNRVYYGADGQLYKVTTSETKADEPRGPMRRRMASKAKEDMTEYMQNAAQLIQDYLPPNPDRIQQSVNSGSFSFAMVDPNHKIRLDFHNYLKSGDRLGVEIEPPTNRLLGMQVDSFLEDAEDSVKMTTTMGLLPDGTIYTATTRLEAAAKDIVVTVENTGHHHTGG